MRAIHALKRETRRVTILEIIFRTATSVGDIQRFNELASLAKIVYKAEFHEYMV